MVSQAELILRVITLWFLVLSQFFLETVWVPLKTNATMENLVKSRVYLKYQKQQPKICQISTISDNKDNKIRF